MRGEGEYHDAVPNGHDQAILDMSKTRSRPFLLRRSTLTTILFLIVFGVPLMLFVGSYRDYYRNVHASESVKFGKSLAELGSRRYDETKQVPASMSDLGANVALPFGVRSADVDPETKIIRIGVVDYKDGGGMLEFVPTIEENGRLAYRCRPDHALTQVMTMDCEKRRSEQRS